MVRRSAPLTRCCWPGSGCSCSCSFCSSCCSQLRVTFDRQSWPDVVLLIDDSRSMGEPDNFTDERVKERALKLREIVRKNIKEQLPARMAALESELAALEPISSKTDDPGKRTSSSRDRTTRENRKHVWETAEGRDRLDLVGPVAGCSWCRPCWPSPTWTGSTIWSTAAHQGAHLPSRCGRAGHQDRLGSRASGGRDHRGRPAATRRIAHQAVAQLEAEQNDSRLGTALRQVIDHFRGGSATVIMFTDGVTTRDETIEQVADYAASKGVPLYFVGIGDDLEVRDLHLDELQVEDVVRVNDILNFQAKLRRQRASRT